MIKVLYIAPSGFSPVKLYRGEGVLERLRRIDPEIEIIIPENQQPWKDILKADVAYFLRVNTQTDIAIMEKCLDMNLPVWYDMDDDYFNLPQWNESASHWNKPEVQAIVRRALKIASVVSVSTVELQKVAEREGRIGAVCVPNAIDDYIFDFHPKTGEQGVMWRGGASHTGDLDVFRDQIKKIQVPLTFIGHNPHWQDLTYDYIPYNIDYYGYMDRLLNQTNFSVSMVPLIDCPFNRSKSNIAALESICAGALPVIPGGISQEWEINGAIHYANEKEFGLAVSQALLVSKDPENWKKCVEWVKENRLLSEVNKKRVEIIQELAQ